MDRDCVPLAALLVACGVLGDCAPEGAGARAGAVAARPGITAALAANIAHRIGHGLMGVAAWLAVALVGSYELLMMIIRAVQVPGAGTAVRAMIPPKTS